MTNEQHAIDYKKNIANKFALVEGSNLKQRLGGENLSVTRKIDGHLQVAFFEEGTLTLLNSNGVEKAKDIKCIDDFAEALKGAGLKKAIIAAELYMPNANGRPRHSDVSRALADNQLKDRLALAPFDIVSIDGNMWDVDDYTVTHKRLTEIFKAENVKPVEMRLAENVDEVKKIYEEWVESEGAEGIVVHTHGNVVWKIKPRHTLDAVAIGYTTTERGIRSMMFAVVREDGLFQEFVEGSTGMTEEQRLDVANRLADLHVESQYVMSDSRGVAYQMVKPELVFEISTVELIAKGNDDRVRMNPLLKYDSEKGWLSEGMTPGVSAINIVVIQERPDKRPNSTDVRVSQLSDLTPFEEIEKSMQTLPESTLIERKVFKKVSGAKTMLHKFLLWKTNKEQSGRFPAYIIYHTDFSNGRKDMIKRDMLYTNDENQARELLEAEIADNIKKGWEEVVS